MKTVHGRFLFILSFLLFDFLLLSSPVSEAPPESGVANEKAILSPLAKSILIIKFQITKVTGLQTEVLAEPTVKTEYGKSASFRVGDQSSSCTLDFLPFIEEGKGVRMKISAMVRPGMTEPKRLDVLIKSNESVLVELLSNKKENSRIILQITPMNEANWAVRESPPELLNPEWGETLVLLNDHLVARGTFGVRNEGGFFLHTRKHGYFLFSFHPFPDAIPNGSCEGNSIKIHLQNESKIEWFAARPPLPQGKWLVWSASREDKPESVSKELFLETARGMAGDGEIGIWEIRDQKGEAVAAIPNLLDAKMDFEFKNASMKTILEFITKVLGVSLSLDQKLYEKKFSCELVQVPIRQFLDLICHVNAATWRFVKGKPGVLRVDSLQVPVK